MPSYREIIDLSNFDNSRFMHTTGQSGNVLSAHYDDLIPKWAATQYVQMYWTRAAVEGSPGAEKLRLEPK